MTCVQQVTPEQWSELLAAIERRDQQDAAEMPDDRAALLVMDRAYERLRKLGWREASYCPKDGSVFEVIEAGSTGIHRAHYEGEWPKGTWWVHDDGDLWPSRPILFRLIREPALGTAARSAETLGSAEGNGPAPTGATPAPHPTPTPPPRSPDETAGPSPVRMEN